MSKRLALFKIAFDLRADPVTDRHGYAIADHSIRVVSTAVKCECVRYALQARIFSNCVRSYSERESRISKKSRAQVFGVMRDAGWCDVAARGITNYRFVAILARQAPVYIIRNVRIWIRLENLSKCHCSVLVGSRHAKFRRLPIMISRSLFCGNHVEVLTGQATCTQ